MQSRYNSTSVKLLVTALDDLHMIRFKQGWFTLIKYEHQVGELKNEKPRQELLEFVKKVREEGEEGEYQGLKKPETWISQLDLRVDNRFKKEAESGTAGKPSGLGAGPYGEATPLKDGVAEQKPKSQSKIALKRQRAAAAKKTAASGGSVHAVGQISFKKNLKLKLGGDAIDKDDDVPQSASDAKVQPIQAESDDKVQLRKPPAAAQEPAPAQQTSGEEKPKAVRPRPQLQLGAKKPEGSAVKVERQVQPPPVMQETIQPTSAQPKDPGPEEQETRPSQEGSKNEVSSPLVVPTVPGAPERESDQASKESKLEEIILKMQKRRGFRQCKVFLAQGRHSEFLVRINNFHFRHRELRPVKRAFERMKINSLSKEVQAYTQDKFQYYLKYVRKLCNIINKSVLSKSQLEMIKRDSFYHWKAQTQFLEALKEKAELLHDLAGPGDDPNLTEEAQTHLIDSVYLHKDSIHWLQNDNVVYLKELRMQTTNAVDGHNFSWQYTSAISQTGNPLAENKARFYALLLSSLEMAHKQHLVVGFDRIWAESLGGDASCASTDNSLTRLQRIRGHMAYLRKVKSSVEARYSTAQLAQPLTLATGSVGNSVYGGSVGASHGQLVAPARTSGSANDRRAIIQIETPAQAPTAGGAIALHVDPQLSVDSKQSINVFEGSVLHSGAIPAGSVGPVPGTQKQHSQANKARTPLGGWESSLNATATEDGSVAGADGAILLVTTPLPGKLGSLEVAGQNQRPVQSQPHPAPDRDAIFLHHIERQLSENIGLMRLYRGMKLASLKHPERNRPQYEEDVEQEEVDRAVEANRQKVWAVQKIAKVRLQVETLRASGLETEDVKALAAAFSKWESRAKKDKLATSKQTLFLQRSQKYKSAIQTLNQSFNPTTRVVERAFDKWKYVLLHQEMLKSDTRIQSQVKALARLMPSAERREAPRPGDQHQSDDVASASMAYQDQRLYQKLNSFMLIKQLLLTQYVQRGTVLQKYISMLKYLAQEQSRLQGGSASRSHQSPALSQRSRKRADGTQTGQSVSAAALQRKHQQEAALIEENVAKLMRCIFRVVFNKWVMFTYNEVQEVQRAREEGMSRMFMALDRLVCRRKLTAVSQMHLYSLFIKNLTQNDEEALESPQVDSLSMMRQQVTNISLDQKLRRSRLSLQLCANVLVRLRFRALQTKFATWKSNCAIIEWRLNQGLLEGNNQSEGAVEGLENLLKGPGMEDSQGLQRVLEELREGTGGASRRSTTAVDEKERIRQMILDFKNARDSEGVKQFFENYYTPKSAAIQQKLQKPWEIKLQREAMKQISQYRGATRAETMLSKSSMPTARDPTLAPLLNASFDRLRLCQTFQKWASLLREPVGRPEQRAFLRILAKFRKKRLAKRFLYWKHSGVAEDGYPLQCELIEQKTLETLSLVGRHLHSQVARTKEQYKHQVRIRLVNRVMAFLRHTNPVAEAFHVWKQETLQIVAQKYAIRQSIADKEELRQQFELLNSQNQKTVEEHIKQIRLSCVKKNGLPCEECQSVQARKVEALAEIKTNQKNYQELDHLVGQRGMRRLLGSSHHQVQVPSQHSPSSSAFGSSDNRSVLRFAGDKQLDRAGGRIRGRPTGMQHSPDQPASQPPGDDARADALAQMIEQENQKLRDKNEKVKEQLRSKQQYIESERQKYQEKIRKLQEQRDQLMQSYQAAVLGL